jgi:hypothetical protein
MAEFKYEEPARLALGQKIYDQYKDGKKKGDTGNVVSLLSDAMTVLRQLGPAGLDVWIDLKGKDGERQFIRNGLDTELAASLKSRPQAMDTAWADIENLMQVLRCAKYYAKTQE